MPSPDGADEIDLSAFAARLGALRPTAISDRDQILFRAGQASVRVQTKPRSRFWPALAAGLAAVAVGEGFLIAHRPEPEVVERIVYLSPPAPTVLVAAETPQPSVPQPDHPVDPPSSMLRADHLARSRWDELPIPTLILPRRLPALSGRDLLRYELRNALQGDSS